MLRDVLRGVLAMLTVGLLPLGASVIDWPSSGNSLQSPSLLGSTDPIFNFNSDAVGKATAFTDTDTVSGLSATFTSSGDPGGFVVGPTFFATLTGNVLLDPGPAGLNNLTLTIAFSAPQASLSMNFATNSVGGVPFDLSAFNGATGVGSSTATGTVPLGFIFPEGVMSFSGPAFNRVVLSAPTALDFAIDNVNVNVSAVPEPGSLSLVAFSGLFGAIVITRLRRAKA